jgi:hypothetical protein
MKKIFFTLALFALAGLNFVNLATADDSVRKELEAVYAKIDAAVKAGDSKTLESLLGEDYEKRSGDKTLNRDEAVAEMKQNFKSIKKVESMKTTIDKIQHVEGNEIVDYTQSGKAVVAVNGKDQAVEVKTKGRDWWVKDDDGDWTCVASERVE